MVREINWFFLQKNEWSASYRVTNQHPNLPWNFITHGFLDPIRISWWKFQTRSTMRFQSVSMTHPRAYAFHRVFGWTRNHGAIAIPNPAKHLIYAANFWACIVAYNDFQIIKEWPTLTKVPNPTKLFGQKSPCLKIANMSPYTTIQAQRRVSILATQNEVFVLGRGPWGPKVATFSKGSVLEKTLLGRSCVSGFSASVANIMTLLQNKHYNNRHFMRDFAKNNHFGFLFQAYGSYSSQTPCILRFVYIS